MSEPTQLQEDDEAGSAGRTCQAAGVIGVLGAGTMGCGIAQLAARSGAQTLLHDPDPGGARARRANGPGRPAQRSGARAG